jgi:S-adenosylmethionine synthetase
MNRLHLSQLPPGGDSTDFEIVERKGPGHPDTLADGLAEAVSNAYARYSIDKYGQILHHNTDKTTLLGGSAEVHFGGGRMLSPVEVCVNGRFSSRIGDVEVPVMEIIEGAVWRYMEEKLPRFDVSEHLRVRVRSSQAASPGSVDGNGESPRARWFTPRSTDDLRDTVKPFANDTSIGVGFSPLSSVERLAFLIEEEIASVGLRDDQCYGSDTKIMLCRAGRDLSVTMAVPQIAAETTGLGEYVERRSVAARSIEKVIREAAPALDPMVTVNARDIDAIPELYLTLTGTSLESGDEGVVGRGNRINGLITPCRPMSLEGAAGKNPSYHVGKLYNVIAGQMAEWLYRVTGRPTSVWLVSRTGSDLLEPKFCAVGQEGAMPDEKLVATAFAEVGADLERTRTEVVNGEVSLTP